MRKFEEGERLVANVHESEFKPFEVDGKINPGESCLQLDDSYPFGFGFNVYRLAPGCSSTPHVHTCAEQFYVVEGDLTDNDGHEYKAGDLVYLKEGTEHYSTTRNGCTVVVFIPTPESNM